jgi:outer membrane lipoprotein-sorting protein
VCNKVKLVSSEATLTYYVTDKIQAPRVKSQLQLDKLEGFPLQMELSNNGMSFVMVAQSVKTDAVDASRFSMSVPMGYTKMTQEELMQMFGNLGGGQ